MAEKQEQMNSKLESNATTLHYPSCDVIFQQTEPQPALNLKVEIKKLAVRHQAQTKNFGRRDCRIGLASLVIKYPKSDKTFVLNIDNRCNTADLICEYINEKQADIGISAQVFTPAENSCYVLLTATNAGTQHQFNFSSVDHIRELISQKMFKLNEALHWRSLTFETASTEKAKTVQLDEEHRTLDGLVAKVLAADIGIKASLVLEENDQYRILFTAQRPNMHFSIDIDMLNKTHETKFIEPTKITELFNTTVVSPGQDAQVSINGIHISGQGEVIEEILPGFKIVPRASGTTFVNLPEDLSNLHINQQNGEAKQRQQTHELLTQLVDQQAQICGLLQTLLLQLEKIKQTQVTMLQKSSVQTEKKEIEGYQSYGFETMGKSGNIKQFSQETLLDTTTETMQGLSQAADLLGELSSSCDFTDPQMPALVPVPVKESKTQQVKDKSWTPLKNTRKLLKVQLSEDLSLNTHTEGQVLKRTLSLSALDALNEASAQKMISSIKEQNNTITLNKVDLT